jgi:hypothetical protein
MPSPGVGAREVEFREVINAARCLVRSGGGRRMLLIHLARGRRSMAGFGNWRGAFCSRPSTTWR